MRKAWAGLITAWALLVPAAAVAAGPALTVPESKLDAALQCGGGKLAGTTKEPVLLVPGTTVEPRENFGWNFVRAFNAEARPWCWVVLPERSNGDTQVAAEYVVHAIRTMHERAGRRIAVVGHSQGGMLPRWAFKWWADTRLMVEDHVGLAPSNHGTVLTKAVCLPGCAPAFWQQDRDSRFLAKLNEGQETWPEIDGTAVTTQLDEVVVPHTSGYLRAAGGADVRNVTIQSICPGALSEHLGVGTFDPTAAALVQDAITHDGPADPARIDRKVCQRLLAPAVETSSAPIEILSAGFLLGRSILESDKVAAEPPLRDYTSRPVEPTPRPAAAKATKKPKAKPKKRQSTTKRKGTKKRRAPKRR